MKNSCFVIRSLNPRHFKSMTVVIWFKSKSVQFCSLWHDRFISWTILDVFHHNNQYLILYSSLIQFPVNYSVLIHQLKYFINVDYDSPRQQKFSGGCWVYTQWIFNNTTLLSSTPPTHTTSVISVQIVVNQYEKDRLRSSRTRRVTSGNNEIKLLLYPHPTQQLSNLGKKSVRFHNKCLVWLR